MSEDEKIFFSYSVHVLGLLQKQYIPSITEPSLQLLPNSFIESELERGLSRCKCLLDSHEDLHTHFRNCVRPSTTVTLVLWERREAVDTGGQWRQEALSDGEAGFLSSSRFVERL